MMTSHAPSRFLPVLWTLAICVLGCSQPTDLPRSDWPASDLMPDQESWDARLAMSVDGSPRISLAAPYMARFTQADSSHLLLQNRSLAPEDSAVSAQESAVVVMLYNDGIHSSTVHAARIRYYQNQGSMIAEGAVTVVTADGRRLETEQLRWDEERRRVYAEGFFNLTTPTEMIRGYGLRADEDLRSYAFARAAGTFEVDE